jgi:hypothetical protein
MSLGNRSSSSWNTLWSAMSRHCSALPTRKKRPARTASLKPCAASRLLSWSKEVVATTSLTCSSDLCLPRNPTIRRTLGAALVNRSS